MSQNLKLPICPRCHETKGIKTTEFKSTKLTYEPSNYYSCPSCNIEWNYWDGIRDNNDKCDSSIHLFYEESRKQARPSYYSWVEYGVGILDCRRLFPTGFSDKYERD